MRFAIEMLLSNTGRVDLRRREFVAGTALAAAVAVNVRGGTVQQKKRTAERRREVIAFLGRFLKRFAG